MFLKQNYVTVLMNFLCINTFDNNKIILYDYLRILI